MVHDRLVRRLSRKIQVHADEICEFEKLHTDDAEIVVIAYGATARAARHAVLAARERGIRAGLLRLKTLWPFPRGVVKELGITAHRFVAAEMNLGQIAREAERYTRLPISWVTHAGGAILPPEPILRAIMEAE
jgi:2-oxoglutarate ferredoxin oxidoreductase subunit alpha